MINQTRIFSKYVKLALATLLVFISLGLTSNSNAAEVTFSDTAGHWAAVDIAWAVEQGVVQGYPDQTFRPDRHVNEAEFITMMVRALFPNENAMLQEVQEKWPAPYYEFAIVLGWPLVGMPEGENYTRGQVARVIAATQQQYLPTDQAIQYLLDHGLAQGKTSEKTIASFAKADRLTRAEALRFITNLLNAESTAPEPNPDPETSPYSLNGIQLGLSEQAVLAKLGEPARKDPTEHGYTWYIYNDDYAKYAQIGIADSQVVALYSNANAWSLPEEISLGATKSQVATYMNIQLNEFNEYDFHKFEKEGIDFTIFFDEHKGGKVHALLLTGPNSPVQPKPVVGTNARNEQLKAYELQLLDLLNSFRHREGLATLEWHEGVAEVAKAHSVDMATNNYFDHENLAGDLPWDRYRKHGLPPHRYSSENIAAGYANAFHAHHGWLNSEGHRRNMLSVDPTMLGTGIAENYESSDYGIFYTQNFYTPLQ